MRCTDRLELEFNHSIPNMLFTGGYDSSTFFASTEMYPISQNQGQKKVGNLRYKGYTQMVSVGGKTTTIYAVGTGSSNIGTTNVEEWNHDQQTWAMAPTEYQMKTGRDVFGLLAVPRDLVC